MADYRLYNLIVDPSSPCAAIRLQQPSMAVPASFLTEPPPFAILDQLLDFHLGNTRDPTRGRFVQTYNHALEIFSRLARYIAYVLYDVRLSSETNANVTPLVYVDAHRLAVFYEAFDIDWEYPFHNILVTVCCSLESFLHPQHVCPRFQTTTLNSLPFELIDMIASLCDRNAAVRLSQTSRRYRDACCIRLWKTARFVARVDKEALRQPRHANRRLVVWLLELVAASCTRASAAMLAFLADDRMVSRLREVTFANEWEFLLHTEPSLVLPPPGVRAGDLLPLLRNARQIITRSLVVHVRFLDFILSPTLFQDMGAHHTLRAATIDGCFCPDFLIRSTAADRRAWSMTGLTYLALGFGRQQHATWMIVSLCPNIRHLYAYATSNDITVDFPWNGLYSLAVVHRLHTLHIDDAEPCLGGLVDWLVTAADSTLDAGSLKRFKLRVKGSVCLPDTVWLLQALYSSHALLEVLVLDGVQRMPATLLRLLGERLPNLQCLRIARRGGEFCARYGFSTWEDPLHEYARSLAALTHLRHFEANFRWLSHTYSPATIDSLLSGSRAPQDVPENDTDCDDTDSCAHGHSDDCMADGASLVLPFAAYCTALQSFAVNADVASFSCTIQRTGREAYRIIDVRDHPHLYLNERWNPPQGQTWSQPYASATW